MLRKSASLLVALGVLATHAALAEPFRIAVSQKGFWDTAMPEFAQRQGYFKQEGLDVDLLYTNGTSETQSAVLSGSVDVGVAVGLLGLFAAYSKGAPVRVIAAQWTGTSDFFWYVRADSPIRSLADTVGKTIAYSTNGSSSHLVILSMLDQAEIKARPTATGGTPATLTQVMSGQIDVGWSVASVGMQDVEEGKIRIIARGVDAKDLGGQTTRVTITSANVLSKRRDALQRFMRAYQKALDWAYSDPSAIDLLAKNLGIPRATLQKAVTGHYPKSGLSPAPIHGIDLSMRQAVELKRLSAPLTADQVRELIVPLAVAGK